MRAWFRAALVAVAFGPISAAQAPKQRTFDGPAVVAWVEDLRSDDAIARETASRALIGAGVQVLPFLDRLLEQHLSTAAELALGRVYGALVGVTPAEAGRVREQVRFALRSEGDSAVREAVREVTATGRAAIEYALQSLGDVDDESRAGQFAQRLRVVRDVTDLASGRNRDDRAVLDLVELGARAHDDLLAVALDTSNEEALRRVATERLLLYVGRGAVDPALRIAEQPSPRMLDLVVPYLCENAEIQQFDAVSSVLVPVLNDYREHEASLTRLADRLDLSALRKRLERRAPAATCSLAAKLLGLRRDAQARSALTELLQNEDEGVVGDAALALGRIGDEEDVRPIASLLASGRVDVRRAAVHSLSLFTSATAKAWTAAALRDGDAAVRAAATRSLCGHGDQDVVDMLIACLDDDEPEVVRTASEGLQRITGHSPERSTSARNSLREQWRSWWGERRSSVKEGDGSASAQRAEQKAGDDPARPLAGEGHRILAQLEETLRQQFRPYGELVQRDSTSTAKLLEAARARVLETLATHEGAGKARTADPELADEDREVLEHFLKHGQFRGAADLAECLGALPLALEAPTYIQMVYEAAEAMVGSLGDRFTRIQRLEDAEGKIDPNLLPSLFGRGETNGIMLNKDEQRVTVEFVLAESSAEAAGLRSGDVVLRIGEDLASSLDAKTLHDRIEEEVSLTVLRDGWSRPVRFTLKPQLPRPERLVVTAVLPGSIGYARLIEFGYGSAQQLEWALQELERQGIVGLILDLRGNPGGLVNDAVSIVDKFVASGSTITTMWTNTSEEGKQYEETKYASSDSDSDRSYPLAVLVNHNSASASEMTSGALQDLKRAVIVGQTSWGKGIGQSGGGILGFPRKSLFGESRSSLGLGITILEYFLPSGRSIQGVGVEPDVPVVRPSFLGERFELMQRARQHAATAKYLEEWLTADAVAARECAQFDAWDPDRYPGFAEWKESLHLELNAELVRRALRAELRSSLAAEDPASFRVDVQDDEDLRAAIGALAEPLGLDLAAHPEYEDLVD